MTLEGIIEKMAMDSILILPKAGTPEYEQAIAEAVDMMKMRMEDDLK